jgi:hypothetical protein
MKMPLKTGGIRGVPLEATKGHRDRGITGLTKEHMRTTDDSEMQTAQVTEMVTAVHQEGLDGTPPSWYTCSRVGKGAAV